MTRKNTRRRHPGTKRRLTGQYTTQCSMKRTPFVTTAHRNPLSSIGQDNRKSSYCITSVAINRWTVERRVFAHEIGGKLEWNRYGSFGDDLMSVDIPFDDECDFKRANNFRNTGGRVRRRKVFEH